MLLDQMQTINNLAQQVKFLSDQSIIEQEVLLYSQAWVGEYKYSAKANDFNGWLICDGRSLDKELYSSLYAIIGDEFGSSYNIFNLPDFRGRVAGVIGTGANLTTRSLGDIVGSETHTLTSNEIPPHTHNGTTDPTTATLNNATNIVRANGSGDNIDVAGSGGISSGNDVSNITENSHTHTLTTSSVGGGQPHNNMQPTLFAGNMFIFSGIVVAAQ